MSHETEKRSVALHMFLLCYVDGHGTEIMGRWNNFDFSLGTFHYFPACLHDCCCCCMTPGTKCNLKSSHFFTTTAEHVFSATTNNAEAQDFESVFDGSYWKFLILIDSGRGGAFIWCFFCGEKNLLRHPPLGHASWHLWLHDSSSWLHKLITFAFQFKQQTKAMQYAFFHFLVFGLNLTYSPV